MEKILVIDNYDSFTFNLVQYLNVNPNHEVEVVRNDQISLAEIERFNTIVLSPGPGLPANAGLLNTIIKTYASSKKILGVCLGMQAMTEVFGGSLSNLKTVKHGVATPIDIIDQNDILYQNLPSTFSVGRYHSWIANRDEFPKSLKITSEDDEGNIMSFTHKEYKLYGVQFHPESILTEHGQQIIDNFLNN